MEHVIKREEYFDQKLLIYQNKKCSHTVFYTDSKKVKIDKELCIYGLNKFLFFKIIFHGRIEHFRNTLEERKLPAET